MAVVQNRSQHGDIWHDIINLQPWCWVWKVKPCPKVHYYIGQQEAPISTVFMYLVFFIWRRNVIVQCIIALKPVSTCRRQPIKAGTGWPQCSQLQSERA